MIEEEYDWEDMSGVIAHREWEKRRESRERARNDIDKVMELSVQDWVQVFLYVNNDSMIKTPLFKELCLFGERTGLNDFGIFNWYPHSYGPHSKEVEQAIDDLIDRGVVEREVDRSSSGRIYKRYTLKSRAEVERLWKLLPKTIKDIIREIHREFRGKSLDEILTYVYSAYPEYTTKAAKKC